MRANWLRRLTRPRSAPLTGGRRSTPPATCRPQLGRLEDRVTPATLLALNSAGNALIRFDSATPGTTVTTPITGLGAGEALQGIDFRPATGQLFGLGVTGTTARLLSINPGTGAATLIGTLSQPVAGSDFGFDFNPTVDRIRVTSDADINFNVNPNDAVVTVQGTLNPGTPNVVGSAYTNNFPNATVTSLFAIDSGTDQLFQQVPATGALALIGNLGVDTTGSVGFDIAGNSNNPAFAVLTVGGVSSLFSINTSTGAAANLGSVGAGQAVRGLAVMRFVWDGAPDTGGVSANANWVTPANWVGDVAPSAGDDLVFAAGAAQLANTNTFAAGTAFNSITFTGTGYTITGNGITLNAGMLDTAGAGTNRVDFDIALAGTQIFSVAVAGHTLALGGVVSGSGSFNKERVGVTTNNAGTLRLDGAASNTFTGVLSVNGGLLELAKAGAVAVPTALLVGDGTGTDTAREIASNQLADTANVTVNVGGVFDLNNLVDTIANLTLNAGQFTSGAGTLTVTGLTAVNGTPGADAFVLGGAPGAATVSINGVVSGTLTGGFTIDGGDGADALTGANLANTWNLTGSNAGNVGGAGAAAFQNVENLVGGTDADLFVFADGAGVTGTVDGGAGTDTLDYSAYTTVVAANLGLGTTGLSANLDGGQEVTPTGSAAAGTAALTYDVATRTFSINLTVTGLTPADVIGFHIHRAPAGVNGPIIVDFAPLGVPIAPLVPAGDGFTFTAAGIPLTALHEAAFLGGLTYVNIHTAAFPGGLIRGQVFTNANVNLATTTGGTGTGTGGVLNVENATGGSGAVVIGPATFGDSLVGSFAANVLRGGDGNDAIVGGPGADTMQGEGGDDVLVWSNGDGSDVMDGGAGTDTVNVNGSVTADDVFTVNPGAGGRLAFARTSPGPFTLDIGTAETLTVNGIGGADSFTANNLAGVTDLTIVNLHGFDGNDTFAVQPSPAATVFVRGGPPNAAPGDSLTVDTTGTANPTLIPTTSPDGLSGSYNFGDRQPVNFLQIEGLTPSGSDLSVTKTDGQDSVLPGGGVTYTIIVANNGPFPVSGVSVADTFPLALLGVTFFAVETGGVTGFTPAGNGDIADVIDMPAGSSVTYTATGTVSAAATGTLDNTATVTPPAGVTDPDLSNNSATDSNTIGAAADVAVFQTDAPDPAVAGRRLTYTLSVTNNGPAAAANVTLSDPLPAGTTLVSFTQIGGPAFTLQAPPAGTNGTVTATAATLGVGETATFSLVVRVAANAQPATTLTNTLTATTTSTDAVPGNNTAAESTNVRIIQLPLLTGSGPGIVSQVKAFDTVNGTLAANFSPYAGFAGGVRVAAGDVTGDGIADIITGAGPGGGPHVKVFDGVTLTEIRSFFAFGGGFTGGVFVAAGDVNDDGQADVIVGAGPGGGPHVRAFSGANGALLADFFAYGGGFQGGVSVAAGDVNGDNRADIVTGAGPGGGPHVRAFAGGGGGILADFFAFAGGFSGGVFVAAGDLTNDGRADIIAGAGPGGTAVRGFNAVNLAELFNFNPYGGFAGGVRVAVANANADGQLDFVTGAGPGGGPHVRAFDGQSLGVAASFFAYDPAFLGGVFVG